MTQPCPDQQHNAVLPSQEDHQSRWERRKARDPYHHGLRQCSYCGSLHPEDVLWAVEHGAKVDGTGKSYKLYCHVPNKLKGRVRVGSTSGPVFARGRRLTRLQRLLGPHNMKSDLGKPTLMERLTGHYDRPIYGEAPRMCMAKVYMWHFTEAQVQRLRDLLAAQRVEAPARG